MIPMCEMRDMLLRVQWLPADMYHAGDYTEPFDLHRSNDYPDINVGQAG